MRRKFVPGEKDKYCLAEKEEIGKLCKKYKDEYDAKCEEFKNSVNWDDKVKKQAQKLPKEG